MTNTPELISTTVVQPGKGAAGELKVGQRIRVIDLEGLQVCDFIAFNADDHDEVSHMGMTSLEQDSWRVGEGGSIYSTRVRPILKINDNKTMVHGYTGGACTRDINLAAGLDQLGCTDALKDGLASIGHPELPVLDMAAFNINQPPLTQSDGTFHPVSPVDGPGDYIEMTALVPIIWALSCCPYPGVMNGYNPTPVEVQILEAAE